MMPSKKATFERVYRDTRYRVFHQKGSFDLEIDFFASECKDFMQSHSAKTAAFITSHNPHSIQLSDEENEVLLNQLTLDVSQSHRFFYASGIPNHSDWPEEKSLFILSINLPEVFTLATKYRQNAFLYLENDFIPKLIWVEDKNSTFVL